MSRYAFYAGKRVSSPGAFINRLATEKLSKLFLDCVQKKNPAGAGGRPGILEIGPGRGDFAAFLLKAKTVDYKGYEPEEALFNELKGRGMDIVNASVPPIAEDNERFAASVAINVLEHMPTIQAAEELLREFHRVLKPGGIVFIVVPSFLDWGREFFNLDYTHQTIMTESRLRQMLGDTGFGSFRITHHYGCFFSGFGRIPNATVRIGRSLISLLLPRSITRSDKYQKAGILFAENIVCCAEKLPRRQ